MTNIRMVMVGVGLAAAVVAGCDPYSKATGGNPAIAEVNATSGTDATAGKVDANGAWTLDVPSTCGTNPVTGALSAFGDRQVLFVTFNKQMDPASIQKSLTDCTPAGATPWLTVTTVPANAVDPTKFQWFSCYSPSSPTAAEGGSAIIFLAEKPQDAVPATCTAAVAPPDGWSGSVPVDVSTTGITSVHAVGDVKDKDGRVAHVDVTANYEPNPATVRNFTATPGATPDALVLTWQHRSCAGSAGGYQYVVRRLDPATGKYTDTGAQTVTVDAANFGLTTSRSVTFTGLPADAVQDFRISTIAGSGATAFEEPKAELTNVGTAAAIAAPGAAPGAVATDAAAVTPTPPVGVTGGVAPVKITVPDAAKVTGATNYDVYRATVTGFGATSATTNYGAFSRLGSTGLDANKNPKEFLDISAAANTRYVYKLVALKSGFTDPKDPTAPVSARSADSPISASVITAPAVEPAGEATVTDTTASLTFPAVGGLALDVPNFTLQRAPDDGGKPGTFVTVAGAAGTPSFDPDTDDVLFTDTGLTANTTYWYRLNVNNTAGRTDTLGGGGSAEGTPMSVKTSPLATPAPITATRTATGVNLSWPLVTGAANYVVERSLAAACGFAPVGTPVVQPTTGTTVTFSDAGAPANVSYIVIARDATGNESAASTPTGLVP